MHVVMVVLALWLLGLSARDIRTRRLPNVLTLPALGGAVAGTVMHPAAVAPGLLLNVVIYGFAFWLGGCGGGDLKLAVTLGAMAESLVAAAMIVVLAQMMTLGMAWVRRDRHPQAHGPPLCIAAVCCGIPDFGGFW